MLAGYIVCTEDTRWYSSLWAPMLLSTCFCDPKREYESVVSIYLRSSHFSVYLSVQTSSLRIGFGPASLDCTFKLITNRVHWTSPFATFYLTLPYLRYLKGNRLLKHSKVRYSV